MFAVMYSGSTFFGPMMQIGLFLACLLASNVAQLSLAFFPSIGNGSECPDRLVEAFNERNLLLIQYML